MICVLKQTAKRPPSSHSLRCVSVALVLGSSALLPMASGGSVLVHNMQHQRAQGVHAKDFDEQYASKQDGWACREWSKRSVSRSLLQRRSS